MAVQRESRPGNEIARGDVRISHPPPRFRAVLSSPRLLSAAASAAAVVEAIAFRGSANLDRSQLRDPPLIAANEDSMLAALDEVDAVADLVPRGRMGCRRVHRRGPNEGKGI